MIDAATFKAKFDRGQFTYGNTLPAIRDPDITKVIAEASRVYNPDIYPDETTADEALTFLSAHFLQETIDAADGDGAAKWNQTSRSASGVSESVQIPEWMNAPEIAMFATTYYGQRFLMLTRPHLIGAVFSVTGGTNP